MVFTRQTLVQNLKYLILMIAFSVLSPVFLSSQVNPVRYIAATQHKTTTPDLSNGASTAWVRRYDGPISGEDIVTSMVVDVFGNVHVTGWSYGIHYEDYATIKYDTEGNELWVARYNHSYNGGDCALALAVDSSRNVYVTGLAESAYAIGTIKYDGNGNVIWENIHEPPYWDNHGTDIAVDAYGNIYVAAFCVTPEAEYRLIKYDGFGNIIWERSYSPPYIEFPVLAIDNQNNVFIAGASWHNYPSAEYIIIKYDETGTELWREFYNGSADSINFVNAIVVDDSGNVYVTGQSLGIGCGFDYATIKYDNDGSQLWVVRYNGSGSGDDKANAITVDNLGNIYVTGISEGNYATVKYDSAGSEQWVATYDGLGSGSDEAYSIVLDDSNNIYITGKSEGSGTGYDYATIKYDSAGIEQWVVRYDGLGNGSDEAYSIAIDGSNNVYVAGKSMGSGTDYDYATIKYVQETGIEERDGSDSEIRYAELLTVTPNPFSKLTEIKFQMQDVRSKKQDISLKIYDVSGRIVKVFNLSSGLLLPASTVSWDGVDNSSKQLPNGVYFIKFAYANSSCIKKLIKIK